MLRSQSRAFYGTENKGHFGLSLDYYVHFTSPIRRYSDLVVHRDLIDSYFFKKKDEMRVGDKVYLVVSTDQIKKLLSAFAIMKSSSAYLIFLITGNVSNKSKKFSIIIIS